MKKGSILLVLIFVSNLCFAQFVTAQKEAESLVTGLLETYPGLSVAVGYGDEIVWKSGFGYADILNETTVTPSHQFRYYSLSKSITGIALIKLIESEKLDIERPITDYLTDLPPAYKDVKVKYLINHTAGVRHYNGGEWMKISQQNCVDASEALNTFIESDLESVPGEKYSYSSFGYVILSRLIEVLSGQSYNAYVKQSILDPLGIESIHPDQSELLNTEVTHYSKWNASKVKGKEAALVNNSCKFGGGGFVGTAEAIVKLHLGIANGLLFSDELLKLYYSGIPTSLREETGYAFGIGDGESSAGGRYHGHTGSALGASAVLLVYEKSETLPKPLVLAILGNIKDAEMNAQAGKVAELFKKEID
ncbi:MAG: serine hydrolase domain-containing protein [Cyclobacteriaceae bacterium]